ncbi:hypothetical protein F1728_17285 [Gimesia benthica]|uniref:Uncharacterized protein n=1 Tax=Gimesia benthica TaxID=2608982 RepID=A0A6I6AGE2_9PLAN|nr:hypothetical protein [Gimesia benthica]QGQ24335.1 hypothetical protein F1728_17285 [Gimesia benthica]
MSTTQELTSGEENFMAADGNSKELKLGFLTTIECPDGALIGGLLVTNHFGRPLEFQCTTPVKPNRTQEVLYGPTLVPFLLGEVIGQTLVDKMNVKPSLILVEQEQALELQNHTSIPVAILTDVEQLVEESDAYLTEQVGRNRLRFDAAHQIGKSAIEKTSQHIPGDADLGEPFERVREALTEAVKMGSSR